MDDSTSFEVGDIVGLRPDYPYEGVVVNVQHGQYPPYIVKWPFFNNPLSHRAEDLYLMSKGETDSNIPEEW